MSLPERSLLGFLVRPLRKSSPKPPCAAALAAGALGVLSLLSGCELAVEVDVPERESQLVAHSFFAPDSAWSVRLRRNADIEGRDDVRNLAVADASVRISDGSGNYSAMLTHAGEGLYLHRGQTAAPGAHPIPGAAYTLEAEAPGLPAIRAVASIPAVRASIEEVERLGDSDDGLGFESYRVRIRIEDPPGTNYYKLELFRWSPVGVAVDLPLGYRGDPRFVLDEPGASRAFLEIAFSSGESVFRYDDYAYFFDPPEVADEDRFFEGVLFSDELFDGEARSFELIARPFFGAFNTVESRYKLVLTALSEDYFRYHHTALLQSDAVDELNIAAALLQTPPVQLHSNVEEGLGVFAGYAAHAFGFDGEGNVWSGEER